MSRLVRVNSVRLEPLTHDFSTYMAAAGLRPANTNLARNSTSSSVMTNAPVQEVQKQVGCKLGSRLNASTDGLQQLVVGQEERRPMLSQQKLNLICMIQFATNLMSTLNGINKQSFQGFKLRVGVNTGPVIAGVIGAQRPFYDIWGDCVNVSNGNQATPQALSTNLT